MSEVRRVTVQLSAPSGDDPGRITYGYFIVEGNTLTMTDGDGTPVRQPTTGDLFTAQLRDGLDADAVARNLTARVWRSLHGREGAAGFNRRLNYQQTGVA